MVLNSLIFWIDGLKASAGVIFGLFAILIYWKVRNNGDRVMDSFQLNESQVLQDYRIIFYGNLMGLTGFIFHVLASIDLVTIVIWKAISLVYILMIMFVLVRWVRMFR